MRLVVLLGLPLLIGLVAGGRIEVRAAEPVPGMDQIDHIVLLMQENRSFDHYFGHLGLYAQEQGITLDLLDPSFDPDQCETDPTGCPSNPDPTDPACQTNSNDPACERIAVFHQRELCDVADLDHSWNGTHEQINNGAMDRFTFTNQRSEDPTGRRAMGWYTEEELPFYYNLYSTFAMADRLFSAVAGPTFPNRFYYLAGTSYVQTDAQGNPQPERNPEGRAESRNRIVGTEGADFFEDFAQRSIFNLLDEAGVSWKIYESEPPLAFANEFTYVRQNETNVVPVADYFVDAAAGTLPQVAYIDPIFIGPENVQNDEHPPANVEVGQKFVFDVINALFNSPNWASSALFLVYDEHGGYFDRVNPYQFTAVAPDNHPPFHDDPGGNDLVFGSDLFDHYGVRIPGVVVSPFSKRQFVSHTIYDQTSVLRFIETRFGLPALSNRDAAADPMLEMFDFNNPQLEVPASLKAEPPVRFCDVPVPSTPGRVTGGGRIDPATGNPVGLAEMIIQSGPKPGGKATFGFGVEFNSGDPAPTGDLSYTDHTNGVKVDALFVDVLLIDPITGTHAKFVGSAIVNGVPRKFTVDVDDLGEPGSADTFSIQTLLPDGAPYTASGVLVGGNIQVHEAE